MKGMYFCLNIVHKLIAEKNEWKVSHERQKMMYLVMLKLSKQKKMTKKHFNYLNFYQELRGHFLKAIHLRCGGK